MAKRKKHRIAGLAARLRLAVDSYGSVTATAAAIGRSEGALRKWLREDAEPTASALQALAQITGVSVEWLICGGECPYAARELLNYLAHSKYTKDCQQRRKRCLRWNELSATRQQKLELLAREEFAAWVHDENARDVTGNPG